MNRQELIKQQEKFEIKKRMYEEQGYKAVKVSVSIIRANVLAMLYGFLFGIPQVILFMMIHGQEGIEIHINLLFFILFLLLMVVHEGLHAIMFAHGNRAGWSSIHFGILMPSCSPYCHCDEALEWKAYILGGLMPFLVLGIGFYILALMLGNADLMFLSVLNIIGAGGDLLIATKSIPYRHAVLLDLCDECGFMAFYKY